MNTQRFTIRSQETLQAMQALAQSYGRQESRDLRLRAAMLQQQDSLVLPALQKLEVVPATLSSKVEDELKKLPRVSGAQVYLSKEVLDILHQS